MAIYYSSTTHLNEDLSLRFHRDAAHPHTRYRFDVTHPVEGTAVVALWGSEIIQVSGDWTLPTSTIRDLNYIVEKTHKDIKNYIDGTIDAYSLGASLHNVGVYLRDKRNWTR